MLTLPFTLSLSDHLLACKVDGCGALFRSQELLDKHTSDVHSVDKGNAQKQKEIKEQGEDDFFLICVREYALRVVQLHMSPRRKHPSGFTDSCSPAFLSAAEANIRKARRK